MSNKFVLGSRLERKWRARLLLRVPLIIFALVALFSTASQAVAFACTATPFTGSYGTVDVLSGAAVDSTATFSVTCSAGAANQIIRFCLNIGPGFIATGPSGERVLRSTTDYLDSEFYFNSARSQVWGSWGISSNSPYPPGSPAGIQQDVTLDGSGGGTFNFTVFARIAAGQQNKSPGSYSWNSSSPTVQYRAQSGATACPTDGGSADGVGSTFTATASSNCNISATSINFGSIGSLSSNVDSTGTLTVQCSNGLPYNIGLSAGIGAGATVATRKMTLGVETISYSLYQNSSRATLWGDTIGVDAVSGTGIGSNQALTIYGRVPPQITPAAGTFIDTIIVTATY